MSPRVCQKGCSSEQEQGQDVGQLMVQEGRLGENMKVHKSQLEKDREKALALQAARKKAGHNPLTPFPVKVSLLMCCLPNITVHDCRRLFHPWPRACHRCVPHADLVTDLGWCRQLLPRAA